MDGPLAVPALSRRGFVLCPPHLSKEVCSSAFPAACPTVLNQRSLARCKWQSLVAWRLWSFLSRSRDPQAFKRVVDTSSGEDMVGVALGIFKNGKVSYLIQGDSSGAHALPTTLRS